jgi:hypothetical protein
MWECAFIFVWENYVKMERRIRIIWALSLLSALLLIGVQAYWLFNQRLVLYPEGF